MQELLTCTGVSKSYAHVPALRPLNLSLPSGRIVGLLGPNGSGKTTLIKMIAGLLTPDQGSIQLNGVPIGIKTKKHIAYLPEHTYLNGWMRVRDILQYFKDFYADFNLERAHSMLQSLGINPSDRLRTLSKGTKEKVQLILVMSRDADLYLLDEPIAGVDPAARDFILHTILTNYNPNATIVISTHLITDIESVLDDVILLRQGEIMMVSSVDYIRQTQGKSVDQLFREVFRC